MSERTAHARADGARRRLALAAIVVAVGSALGSPPATASAGELHVHAGQLPDGTASAVGPWNGLSINTSGGTGSFGVAASNLPDGASTQANLAPPPDLSIDAAAVKRSFSAPVSADHSQPQIHATWENRGWPYSGISGQGGYLGDSGTGELSVGPTSGLGVRVSCVRFDSVPGSCPSVSYTIHHLDLTLRDDQAPTVSGTPSGPLVDDAGWQTGATGGVRLIAADRGSGVYRAFVREGSRTWYAPADPASPRCRDAVPANASAYDFVPSALTLVPCPTASTQLDPEFDLAAFGDGTHVVSVGIEDAGGNERTVLTGRTLRVNAPGGALPDPGTACSGGRIDDAGTCRPTGSGGGGGGAGGAGGVTPVPGGGGSATVNPPPTSPPAVNTAADSGGGTGAGRVGNGDRAGASAQLRLRVAGSERSRLTIAYGRPLVVTGTLTTRGGQPIAGAAVTMATARAGTTTRGADLVTDRDGGFRVVLAAGVSRTVRFGYRAFADDAEEADNVALELAVRARARLRVSPHRLRNGAAITLRGSVAGASRRSRKLVELQVLQAGRWVTFATTRLRAGRFTHRYRFKRTTVSTRYVFRALVPADAAWPYATGASNHVAAMVRP